LSSLGIICCRGLKIIIIIIIIIIIPISKVTGLLYYEIHVANRQTDGRTDTSSLHKYTFRESMPASQAQRASAVAGTQQQTRQVCIDLRTSVRNLYAGRMLLRGDSALCIRRFDDRLCRSKIFQVRSLGQSYGEKYPRFFEDTRTPF